ncbi:MAG: Flavodoxin reductase family protein [Ilumatobacteraceae bacterium]|nr:Flavodoxin reductase family protein [Ilumatobacteraceae bacterium]
MSDAAYDLVIIGGNSAGLSVAVALHAAGLQRVRILEAGSAIAFPELVSEHQLDVGYGEPAISVDVAPSPAGSPALVSVSTAKHTYVARGCVVAQRAGAEGWTPTVTTVASDRILINRLPDFAADEDVLVIGHTDRAVELTARLAAAGAGVVLAAGGMDPKLLSPMAEAALHRLERERHATLLYRAVPEQIADVDGYPMAYFGDRRTPDLQFDHVVFAPTRTAVTPAEIGLTEAAATSGVVWFLEGADVAEIAKAFPEITITPAPTLAERRRGFTSVIDDLRAEHYNATITHFEPTHSDLWVLRVRPDHGDVTHLPGQYASLGLGYWEARIDDAEDDDLDGRWDKMVRRSYSISSRMWDEHGYLTGDLDADELEFYIVLVPPTPDNVPGLTPRLACKRPGDRIYLGPKVAGRYTLAPVTDPSDTLLFFSTGTGEAPHNAMIVELLRKAHHGPIVSAVSVRKWADLGYVEQHRALEARYPNYHYLPMPTREADIPKQYLQDLIANDVLTAKFGITLDPEHTHMFLCGNPAMIGLPEETDGEVRYPEVVGVVQLLAERGFTLDHRKTRGNIHFEEYW